MLEKTRKLFIQNLKKLRKAAGLTQSGLAEKLEMSVRGYQKYEQGESFPGPETLQKIAEYLDCNPPDLYRLTPTPDIKPTMMLKDSAHIYGEPSQLDAIMNILQRLNLNQKESDLLSIFKLLNDKGQDIVLSLARTTLDTHPRSLKRAD